MSTRAIVTWTISQRPGSQGDRANRRRHAMRPARQVQQPYLQIARSSSEKNAPGTAGAGRCGAVMCRTRAQGGKARPPRMTSRTRRILRLAASALPSAMPGHICLPAACTAGCLQGASRSRHQYRSSVFERAARFYGRVTMSALVVPTMSKSSFCSDAGTLNLSRDFLNSAAMTPHSFSVMLRWACDSFMGWPVY